MESCESSLLGNETGGGNQERQECHIKVPQGLTLTQSSSKTIMIRARDTNSTQGMYVPMKLWLLRPTGREI